MTNQLYYINHMTLRAKNLVMDAQNMGLVITIEQRPLQPLAMGNTETVVSVRPERERAKPFDLDRMCEEALDRLRQQIDDAAMHASYLVSVQSEPASRNWRFLSAPCVSWGGTGGGGRP